MGLITQDKYVCLAYRLHLDSGEYLRGTPEETEILTFVAGYQELLPALERRLWGLREQDHLEFMIPAEEAFGHYDPELVQTWSRKRFPPEVEPQVGQKVIRSGLPELPEYPLTIKEIRGDMVILDLNHPLADQDLNYEVEVLEVRDATPEELGTRKICKSCQEEMEGMD